MIITIATPYCFKNRELKNRLIAAPPPTFLPDAGGSITPEMLEYYKALSQTGAAVVLTESMAVSENSCAWPKQLNVLNAKTARSLGFLAEKIRSGGAYPGVRLFHGGIYAMFANRKTAFGPSETSFLPLKKRILPLSRSDISRIINDHTNAAQIAWNTGFSSIEIQAAEGSLAEQFLSPLLNKRTDEYGFNSNFGSGLLVSLIRAVKQTTPDMLVSVCLSMKDLIPGGRGLGQTIKIAKLAEEAGADMLRLTEGLPRQKLPALHPFLNASAPEHPFLEDALVLKHELSVPTALSGKISSYESANKLLGSNSCDFLALGRTLNREPQWGRIAANSADGAFIRTCLRCPVCLSASAGCPDKKIQFAKL